jgi:hypothetical protein
MDALNGMLNRALEHGRTVPISGPIKNAALIESHEAAAATVRALYEKCDNNPNVGFAFYDNSGAGPVLGDLALTQKENYGEKRDQLYAELERRRPNLPKSVYEAAKGSGPGGVGGQDGSRDNQQAPGSPRQGGQGSQEPEVTAAPSTPPSTVQTLAEFRKRPDATAVPKRVRR